MKAKKNEPENIQVNEIEEVKQQEEIPETPENSEEETRTTGGQIIDIVTDAVTNAKEQTKELY